MLSKSDIVESGDAERYIYNVVFEGTHVHYFGSETYGSRGMIAAIVAVSLVVYGGETTLWW